MTTYVFALNNQNKLSNFSNRVIQDSTHF